MKKKKKFKHEVGSALLLATILLFVVLSLVVSLSYVTVMEQKMSSKTKSSVGSFFNADSGIEWALNNIANGQNTDTLITLFPDFNKTGTDCASGSCTVCPFGGCKVYLLGADGAVITTGTTKVSEIRAVRSVGTQGTETQRAIEAAVAAGVTATQLLNSTDGSQSLSKTVTTSGGDLIIFASGSGWKSGSGGTIGMQIKVDGTNKGEIKAYTNEASSHKSFVANPLLVTGVSSGSHTIALNAESGTNIDSNDYFSLTVLEVR